MQLIKTLFEKGFTLLGEGQELYPEINFLLNADTDYNEALELLDKTVFDALKEIYRDDKIIMELSRQYDAEQAKINNDGFNTVFPNENPMHKIIYVNNEQLNYKSGGEVDKKQQTYQKWKSLVNMSKGELEKFYNSDEGKAAGISADTAKELGISRGRTSAKWIMKMKETPVKEWTPEMWKWANKHISFISRMKGNKGGLYDDNGEKTRKHTSLLIWGHNPQKKYEAGGEINFDSMKDFDWDAFYNAPIDDAIEIKPENELLKQKIETLQNLVDNKIFVTETQLTEWQNKSYKKNSNIVYGGGDDIHGPAMSIGSINEARKRKNITRLQHQVWNLQKAKQILSSYNIEREGDIHENLRSDYRRQDYLKPNGKRMSTEEEYQVDEGYNIIFELLKTSFKAGGQVKSGDLLDINSLLGFSIDEFLDKSEPKTDEKKKSKLATGIEVMPLGSIYTDESRFQNRDKLNQELVDDIAANWSDADQDPIHIWKDPKKQNKYFVLSGHHRYYGAKKANRKTVKIIDRSKDFTEEQAIRFAKEEANANRTMETPLERAKALRIKRLRGDSRDEINKFLDREGKNKNYVNNLSFLNPAGKALKMLEQFGAAEDKQLQKETEQRADWIGEARRTILGITDAHENELFDFLFDKSASKRVSTKAEFLQKVRSVVNPMQPDEPLNIARFKLQTQGETVYEEMVSEKKAAIAERQDKINKLNDRFNNPYAPDFVSTESPGYDSMRKIADNKISQLDAERKVLQKQLEDIYRDKMKYTAATTSGTLFLNFKAGGELPVHITDQMCEEIFEYLNTWIDDKDKASLQIIDIRNTNMYPTKQFVKYAKTKDFDYGSEIKGLYDKIKSGGIIYPIIVEKSKCMSLDENYKLIKPERPCLFIRDGIHRVSILEELGIYYVPALVYQNNSNSLSRDFGGDFKTRQKFEKWVGRTIKSLYENPDTFKTGGELSGINDLLGFSIEEFLDKEEPKTDEKKKEKILDYGEKIGGAKKDLIRELHNINGSDLASQPLSKIFPAPNYLKLFEQGIINQEGAILLKYMYDGIPTKPRKTYRIPRWINEVQTVINTFKDIIGIDAPENKEYAFAMVDGMHSSKLFSDRKYEMFYEIMKGFDFPKNPVNLGTYTIMKFDAGYRLNNQYQKEQVSERYTIVNGRYIVKDYPTMAEAIMGLKLILLFNKEKSKSEGTKFNVYQDRTSGDYFIGKKGSINVIRLIEGFPTGKEAFAFLKGNQPKLQSMWDAMKEVPEERNESNRARVGVDWRKGRDISSEEFGKTFGFRGVEFGNWVNNNERQQSINEAFDALMDLAGITGVSASALSLSGQLGFAFGARGSGRANAHYEPDKVVINLTKTRGAGSLGHEWWHALDNYFSRMRGRKLEHITDFPRSRYNNSGELDKSVREEIFTGYKGVVDAINKSGLPKRSQVLDSARSKQYWSTIVEMSARSFEGFIIDKLHETNQVNDYLANFKEMGDWVRDTNGNIDAEKNYPYPIDTERAAINEAYQQFFNVLQVKKDDVGKDVIFETGGELTEEKEIPDTMNTGYDARVHTNMEYIGSKLEDWRPVPIKGFVMVPGPKGKMKEMPEFDFPKGYTQSKTLYVSSQDSPCCELCGKSPIAIFYYIQNDKEKTTMITGSECVTHFGEGKSGKENLRTTKINLAIMMDHDLGTLAKFIRENFSYMHHIGYGRQERKWENEYVGPANSDNNKKYNQVKDDDLSILLNPKNIEYAKMVYKDEPKYIEQENYKIDWKYILSSLPSFGWKNQLDLIKRNYDSQESAEKKLLTWYKKNEQSGRMLLEKITKILKVLDKYDENVLNSEYLSAVNTV